MTICWRMITGGIEEAEAANALDFIEALRPSNTHWWEGNTCPWVFRGHALEQWSLLPSAWRPGNTVIDNCRLEAIRRFDEISPSQTLNWFWHPNFWSGAAIFGDRDKILARQLTVDTTAEYLPIWEFSSICDDLGMPVPLSGPGPDTAQDPNWLAEPHSPLWADEFMKYSDLPAALALAQHHGIPTRLLDWTRNPMAAAFFAVEPLREPQENAKLVVWALHKGRAKKVTTEGITFPNAPHGAPRFDPYISVVRPSTRDNPFLAAQAGLFTTLSFAGIYYLKSGGRRPSLDTFISEANPSMAVLRKLSMSHIHLIDLVRILRRERISRSILMPTMDNVAQDVLTKWSLSPEANMNE